MTDRLDRHVLVLSAADGAGSAASADEGAELACRTFVRLAEQYITGGGLVEELKREDFRRWLSSMAYVLALDTMAKNRPYQDHACTFIGALVGDEAASFVQLGDGAIVVNHAGGNGWQYIFWPQHGEQANMTNFLVNANALQSFEFCSLPYGVAEISMFTDGLENLVLRRAEKAVHAPFFDRAFALVRQSAGPGFDEGLSEQLKDYLSSDVLANETHDDITLVLASKRPNGAR